MPTYTHPFEVAAVLSTSLETWAEQVELRERAAAPIRRMGPICARTREALDEARRRLDSLLEAPPGRRWTTAYEALTAALRELHERWMDSETALREASRGLPPAPGAGTRGQGTPEATSA